MVEFPLVCETTADLVTVREACAVVTTSVLSFNVFPSVSSPLSLISVTLFVLPGLLAVASTVFIIFP